MKQKNIEAFFYWSNSNGKSKQSDYFKNVFENDEKLFIERISEWAENFDLEYGFNPFDKNLQGITFDFVLSIIKIIKNNTLFEIGKSDNYYSEIEKIIKKDYVSFLASKMYGEDLKLYEEYQNKNSSENKVPFEKEFTLWLTANQNFTNSSAKSYISYLKAVNEKVVVFEGHQNFFLISIQNLYTNFEIEKLLDFIDRSIKAVDIKIKDDSNSKYKSSLKKYREFLEIKNN